MLRTGEMGSNGLHQPEVELQRHLRPVQCAKRVKVVDGNVW